MRCAIRKDILSIQLSDSKPYFEHALKLFFIKCFLDYFKTNFVDNKGSWYEGYSAGEPSQINAIENSHRQMKAFEGIKSRTPCIKFMKGKCKDMLEEWSNQRSPTFTRTDGVNIPNPN